MKQESKISTLVTELVKYYNNAIKNETFDVIDCQYSHELIVTFTSYDTKFAKKILELGRVFFQLNKVSNEIEKSKIEDDGYCLAVIFYY